MSAEGVVVLGVGVILIAYLVWYNYANKNR